jgi:hypothetical protein
MIIVLLFDERLTKLYASPQELIMEMTNRFIYGIAPHNQIA